MSPIQTVRRRAAVRRLRRDEVRGLPGAVLLIQVAVAGGCSPRGALAELKRFSTWPGSIGTASDAIGGVAHRIALGASFDDALAAAEHCKEIGPTTQRVLDLLRRSELDGEPVGVLLDVAMVELRRERANSLDAAAQRLTVALLFPLVLCILPAFIVLAIVPLVIAALSGLPG